MKIQPQSEAYGLPTREAGKLPSASEFSDLLQGSGITPGYMSNRVASSEWDEEEI
jgi:hypothetical protein